ncbi:right-handed parallel beta-helix repeat-containing protein [Algibacter miyuki]|uniref:Right-handed parallel beta-helix repeat-containing protein n=1 Tax=Algibacter miyuki TaxID=1306933 RepID=A0ABV5GYC4_9FLAO|nr:right-handed parallel beta-helix repeat-containing protein [Algibacter miyuki]MDN3667147.1 right-handed parallel beta-helix repeat-containing protein [Algibacter miyuki]
MKFIFRPMLIPLFSLLFIFTGCTEEALEEIQAIEEKAAVVNTNEDNDTNSDVDSSLPCEFKLENVEPNSIVIINCVMDLGYETVTLPSNVSIIYEGGDIINGTLSFSEGSIISGELLNSTLTVAGVLPELKNNVFNFLPERWEIIEDKVEDDVALSNRKKFNDVMLLVQKLGGTKFEVDNLNAYFDVSSRVNNPKIKSESAILLPSNFELSMTDNTYLRVQPNNAHAYSLIMVFKGENIKVTGGNLIGDRYEHDYTPVVDLYGKEYDTHEWGHVTHVSGGVNVTLEGINILDGSGDGFVVHGSSIRATDGTPGNAVISKNVTLRNCTIDGARRNGLSILDGDGILVENCNIFNTAEGDSPSGVKYSSAGAWPMQGISFEAWRVREADGTLKEYEKIENVVLRGNTFKNNRAGDVVLFTGSFITIEDNYFDGGIGNIASHDIIIRNNTMESRIENGVSLEYGIKVLSRLDYFGNEFNYNYQIYGNKVTGYKNPMVLSGENFEVYDNVLKDFKSGITLGKRFYKASFYNNTLETDLSTSYGYVANGADVKDIFIKNETINVGRRSVDFYDLIANSEKNLVFDNCNFNAFSKNKSNIDGCENITIQNSQFNVDFSIVDNSKNILLINNNN